MARISGVPPEARALGGAPGILTGPPAHWQGSGAADRRGAPLEKLVIQYAVEMTKTPVEVPDSLFSGLRQHSTRPSWSS